MPEDPEDPETLEAEEPTADQRATSAAKALGIECEGTVSAVDFEKTLTWFLEGVTRLADKLGLPDTNLAELVKKARVRCGKPAEIKPPVESSHALIPPWRAAPKPKQ